MADAAVVARLCRGALAKPGRAAGDQPALFCRGHRPPGRRRRAQDGAPPLCRTGDEEVRRRRDPARRRRADRRRIARLCAAIRLDCLSRELQLQDGPRPARGRRRPAAGARARRAARGRRLGDAGGDLDQHQRADDHDRRKGCGGDPRRRPPAARGLGAREIIARRGAANQSRPGAPRPRVRLPQRGCGACAFAACLSSLTRLTARSGTGGVTMEPDSKNIANDGKERCGWCLSDPLYIRYHDIEWGVPVYDDNKLFEFLILEGAQAGLSWLTILKRREGYRKAFAGFIPDRVARFDERDVQRLTNDQGIIRNKAKISAAISNAQQFLKIREQYGSFANYSWQFVGGNPIVNRRSELAGIPATSRRIGRLQQRPETARLQIRRFYDRVRAYAGRRHGR